MRQICCFLLCATLMATSGCVTQGAAQAQAEAAFRAGEQAALMRQQQARGPSVTVVGEVRDPFVPWTPELTLARAIVLAGFYGEDPRQIIIVRDLQDLRIDPVRLLRGEDIPLQQGDVVRLLREPPAARP